MSGPRLREEVAAGDIPRAKRADYPSRCRRRDSLSPQATFRERSERTTLGSSARSRCQNVAISSPVRLDACLKTDLSCPS
jgi:hypothetical protein